MTTIRSIIARRIRTKRLATIAIVATVVMAILGYRELSYRQELSWRVDRIMRAASLPDLSDISALQKALHVSFESRGWHTWNNFIDTKKYWIDNKSHSDAIGIRYYSTPKLPTEINDSIPMPSRVSLSVDDFCYDKDYISSIFANYESRVSGVRLNPDVTFQMTTIDQSPARTLIVEMEFIKSSKCLGGIDIVQKRGGNK